MNELFILEVEKSVIAQTSFNTAWKYAHGARWHTQSTLSIPRDAVLDLLEFVEFPFTDPTHAIERLQN